VIGDSCVDTDDDLLQELDSDAIQAATPSAASQSHLCSQVDSSAATAIPTSNAQEVPKRKGRQLGSKNKKTLQREATIGSAMQALQAGGTQAQRDEALQALQAARQEARPASWFKRKGFKKECSFIGHRETDPFQEWKFMSTGPIWKKPMMAMLE
jgi:hypothetical protein